MLDLVLVERPLGDEFLNDELWQSTDMQVAGLDKKALLDDNGLRVGQVVGMNPAKLQNLVASDRYCVISRRQTMPAGTPVTIPLGPVIGECNYCVKTSAGTFEVALSQGQCTLAVVPSLTKDGRTTLKFTPQVLYGSQVTDYQVAAGRTGFECQYKRPGKTYEALSWEVTLAPNQYLVIGTVFDPDILEESRQSLGNQFFLVEKGQTITQRLLVIRTTRGAEASGNQELATPAGACMQ